MDAEEHENVPNSNNNAEDVESRSLENTPNNDDSEKSKNSFDIGSIDSKDDVDANAGSTEVIIAKQHKKIKKKKKKKHSSKKNSNLEHIYENTVNRESQEYQSLSSEIHRLEQLREHLIPVPSTPGKPDLRELALEMAIHQDTPDERKMAATCKLNKQIDYVLVYQQGESGDMFETERSKFFTKLDEEGFEIHNITGTGHVFILLHCSFERLAQEAEHVSLKMPLLGLVQPVSLTCNTAFWNSFRTEYPVDYISAPFCLSKLKIYLGHEDKSTFFRPALRSLLVHHILMNMDIREDEKRNRINNTHGLGYMQMIGAFSDAFNLHEKSSVDAVNPVPANCIEFLPNFNVDSDDPRREMKETWLKSSKFQPLWKIRNYFGEKIALYFSWLGLMVTTLWIPTFLGIGVFLYGFILAVQLSSDAEESANTQVRKWFARAFDNDATPFFAFIICIWGTVFLEMWKRKNSQLAYEWDVDDFEEQEPNRPEFYGTKTKPDPVTGEDHSYYPFKKKLSKMTGSFGCLMLLVLLVIVATFAIIVYRVIARVDLFSDKGTIGPLLASTTSSLLNTVVIMIMGRFYQTVAMKLTNWENHRTQTGYEDALIIKLFAFQFVNSYSSLFYIAFFRERTSKEGILDKGPTYSDGCGDDNDCMTLLSIQVAMLMIVKPLPKLLTDLVLPWLKKMYRKMKVCMCGSNKVSELEEGESTIQMEDYLEREMQKEPVKGEFTLSEYNEKVIQYGFLMLFTAAFPLAPLIAIVTNLLDMRIDARRLLFWTRRPIALRAEDIGMWYTILQFLNMVGVVTNAFLITFTSHFGRSWGVTDTTNSTNLMSNTTVTASSDDVTVGTGLITNRLWIIIIFEHVVFSFKFVLAWLIPDTPGQVRLAMRREKYHVSQVLAKAGVRKGPGNIFTEPADAIQRRQTAPAGSIILRSAQASPGHSRANLDTEAYPQENAPTHLEPPRHRKKKSHRKDVEISPRGDEERSPRGDADRSPRGEIEQEFDVSLPPPPNRLPPLHKTSREMHDLV